MNIEDFTPQKISFSEIFEAQKQIKFLYEPKAATIFDNFDIDIYEDQEVFKKYCWRITEELMESLEARKNPKHFREELIDGFNFLVELFLLYGWTYEDVKDSVVLEPEPGSLDFQILRVVYNLGMTANLLKNRQWRNSHYLVDLYIFEPRLKNMWAQYIRLFQMMEMTDEDIQGLWSLKFQVNLFRINSNY